MSHHERYLIAATTRTRAAAFRSALITKDPESAKTRISLAQIARGTAPTVLLNVLRVFRGDPRAVVAVFDADTGVRPTDTLLAATRSALELTRPGSPRVRLLGLEGADGTVARDWIVPARLDEGRLRRVQCLVRATDPAMSAELAGAGAVAVSGHLVASAGALVELFHQVLPGLLGSCVEVMSGRGTGRVVPMPSLLRALPPRDLMRDVLMRAPDRLDVYLAPAARERREVAAVERPESRCRPETAALPLSP